MRKMKSRIRKRIRSGSKSKILTELSAHPSPILDLTPSLFLLPNHALPLTSPRRQARRAGRPGRRCGARRRATQGLGRDRFLEGQDAAHALEVQAVDLYLHFADLLQELVDPFARQRRFRAA